MPSIYTVVLETNEPFGLKAQVMHEEAKERWSGSMV